MKLTIIVAVVVAAWLATLYFVTGYFPDWETRGQFGDLFGSLTAFFSGLAFAGLLYTIMLQRSELALQREELRLQREEMSKSREELATQANIQRAQYHATVAQIQVAVQQARLEVQKMIAETKVPLGRQDEIDIAKEIVDQMNNYAASLGRYILE